MTSSYDCVGARKCVECLPERTSFVLCVNIRYIEYFFFFLIVVTVAFIITAHIYEYTLCVACKKHTCYTHMCVQVQAQANVTLRTQSSAYDEMHHTTNWEVPGALKRITQSVNFSNFFMFHINLVEDISSRPN